MVAGKEAWSVCFPSMLSLYLECVLCLQMPEPYNVHRADVVGAVSALAGLLELKGMSVSSVNSMIL